MKIGFIGLGNVGGKLAESLFRNQFDLTVHDLDKAVTDNFKSKYLINDQCFKYKKILISAALYNFELQLFAFRSWHKNSPCYRCIFPTKILSSQNCSDIGILTTVAGMGGLLQANMTLNVILGNSKNIFNFFHIFNSITNESKKITISKNKNCKVCRI